MSDRPSNAVLGAGGSVADTPVTSSSDGTGREAPPRARPARVLAISSARDTRNGEDTVFRVCAFTWRARCQNTSAELGRKAGRTIV